jgi:ketosteroid isomerase-like protein
MTEADDRVELLRRGWRSFEEGDPASVLAYFDPEVEVYADPEAGNPGTFRGHDGFLSWVGQWYEAWDEFSQEALEIEAVGERCAIAIVRQRARGRLAGLELERTVAYLYEVRDDKVVYMGLFADESAARAAASGRESA